MWLDVCEVVSQNVLFHEVFEKFKRVVELKGVVMFAHERDQMSVRCLNTACLDCFDVLDKLSVDEV